MSRGLISRVLISAATVVAAVSVVGGVNPTSVFATTALSTARLDGTLATQNITVTLSGLTIPDGGSDVAYVQQCLKDDTDPLFDRATDCSGYYQLNPTVTAGSGTAIFTVFNGDEPNLGEFSCGPLGSTSIPNSDTCYIRVAPGLVTNEDTDEFTAINWVTCPAVGIGGTLNIAPAAGINWIGCNLTGANLAGADLTGANLAETILTNADLAGADISGANVATSVLAGAADVTGLRAVGMVGTPTSLPTNWFAQGTTLMGPGADVSGLAFSGINFSSKNLAGLVANGARFVKANLTAATLAGGSFVGTSFTGSTLTNALIDGANLRGASFRGVTSGGVSGTPFASPADGVVAGGSIIAPGAIVTAASVAGADLSSVDTTGLRASGLTGAPSALPAGAAIVGGRLVGPGADLRGADLSSANLTGKDLSDALLTNANFTNAVLTGADLTNAELTGVTWTGARCADGQLAATHNLGSCANAADTTNPTVSQTQPTAAYSLSPSVVVSWTAADAGGSGVASTAVRWQRALSTGGALSSPVVASAAVTGSTYTFTGAALGYRYCFSVNTTDRAGNQSGWSTAKCTTLAVDDRSFTSAGVWAKAAKTGWFASTGSTTTAAGASLTSVGAKTVKQVGVIATTCAACGSVDVFVGATKIGRISLVSATTVARAVVTLPRSAATKTGVVKLVSVTAGKSVAIDGVILNNF